MSTHSPMLSSKMQFLLHISSPSSWIWKFLRRTAFFKTPGCPLNPITPQTERKLIWVIGPLSWEANYFLKKISSVKIPESCCTSTNALEQFICDFFQYMYTRPLKHGTYPSLQMANKRIKVMAVYSKNPLPCMVCKTTNNHFNAYCDIRDKRVN